MPRAGLVAFFVAASGFRENRARRSRVHALRLLSIAALRRRLFLVALKHARKRTTSTFALVCSPQGMIGTSEHESAT